MRIWSRFDCGSYFSRLVLIDMRCRARYGNTHIGAGNGAGRGHAAKENSGQYRLYCDSELHFWAGGDLKVERGDCVTWTGRRASTKSNGGRWEVGG